MEVVWKRQWGLLVWFSVMIQFFLLSHCHLKYPTRFFLVEMNNGIVKITVSRPYGNLRGIKYHGVENLLDDGLDRDDRGYWDCSWEDVNGSNGKQSMILGDRFQVIMQTSNQVEVSFKTTWKSSDPLPALNVDKRYVMLSGSSGFYTYAIYERLKGWPGMFLWETRIVFKLSQKWFQYMAISDTRQRIMPTIADRERGQSLAYPEAVLLKNPMNSELEGEVDDKYQYSSESKNDRVHGWISLNSGIGFWIITPSYEFLPLNVTFENGEPWKKVFGPVFIHLNSVSDKTKATSLWGDAKQQTWKEIISWPYSFPHSPDFLKSDQRGSVIGQLSVQDQYLKVGNGPARFAHVGLAAPGDARSWEYQTKGYQFWTRTDEHGNFFIKAVLPGAYNLHAWVSGVMGNYMYEATVTVTPGSVTKLPPLVFKPPRDGPTLWEIGIPNRHAAEFYVPNVTKNINTLYLEQDKFRQYGLWERYAELYPENDLVFTVGTSDYAKDWFFAHVLRRLPDGKFKATTWQIVFDLPKVDKAGTYKLRLVLAAAHMAEVQVRVNRRDAIRPDFTTGLTGRDNAIARHGIHGVQRSFTAALPGSLFVNGRNTIFLHQPRNQEAFQGVMYDYIRLEGPPQSTH
ncbi:hypothetical protein AAG906_024123 [Vitis piasezkii]